jgi:flagellar biosynthesis/type III secretory pathway protein FliH
MNKSMHLVDHELLEQMYKAVKGLNDGLSEVYKMNMFHAKLIKELHARIDELEKKLSEQ